MKKDVGGGLRDHGIGARGEGGKRERAGVGGGGGGGAGGPKVEPNGNERCGKKVGGVGCRDCACMHGVWVGVCLCVCVCGCVCVCVGG